MNTFQKTAIIFSLALGFLPGTFVFAADTTSIHVSPTIETWDHGTWHLARQKSDTPISSLGKINDALLLGFGTADYEWSFKNGFVPVLSTDPATALGYPKVDTSASLLSVPKKSACASIKTVISSVVISDTKSLCLLSSAGGDFKLELLPEKTILSVGYGKQPILSKTSLTWFGYDGNLYTAYLHPSFFDSTFSAVKTKTNNAVFLIRNGLQYFIPSEQIFYSWFDSFKSVSVITSSKLNSYMDIGNASFRPNSLLKFSDAADLYVFQPANDPYITFGKSVKITDNQSNHWMILKSGTKTPISVAKRPALLRHIATELDLTNLYGPNWKKNIIEIDAAKKSVYTISPTDFNLKTDLIIE